MLLSDLELADPGVQGRVEQVHELDQLQKSINELKFICIYFFLYNTYISYYPSINLLFHLFLKTLFTHLSSQHFIYLSIDYSLPIFHFLAISSISHWLPAGV